MLGMLKTVSGQPLRINDGERAYPVATESSVHQRGMSLRDHFAGLAVQGLCSASDGRATRVPSIIADEAYRIADAMLARRELP
jgi:hypothetical protein